MKKHHFVGNYFILFCVFGGAPVATADNGLSKQYQKFSEQVKMDSKLPSTNCIGTNWPQCLSVLTHCSPEVANLIKTQGERLEMEFRAKGLRLGAPLYLRSVKHSSPTDVASPGVLEVYAQDAYGTYKFFKRYDQCASTSENVLLGFYNIEAGKLNVSDPTQLGFELDYPNGLDKILEHKKVLKASPSSNAGACGLRHAFGIDSNNLAELLTILDSSLNRNETVDAKGNRAPYRVPFASFPYPMTPENMATLKNPSRFTKDLSNGYQAFEEEAFTPEMIIENDSKGVRYRVAQKRSHRVIKRECP
ncbi:MAG: hypothetical protein H7333_08425 [Bdellovibrionales bacterium]|nr:hypothetical protein [Oligoflexia bacterium]